MQKQPHSTEELTRLYLNETLSPELHTELNERLQTDLTARRRFLRSIVAHAEVKALFRVAGEFGPFPDLDAAAFPPGMDGEITCTPPPETTKPPLRPVDQ